MNVKDLQEKVNQFKVDLKVKENKLSETLSELKEHKVTDKNAEPKLKKLGEEIENLEDRKESLLTKAETILKELENESD